MNQSTSSSTETSPRHLAVNALRYAIERADPGTRAALKRADFAAPPTAFYRVTVDILDEDFAGGGTRRAEIEARWIVVAAAMASAEGLLSRAPFGEALARAGVAEMRVLRLLEAHGSQLADLTRTIVHQLVQKAQSFDPQDLADLVLSDQTGREREPRARIARAFYRNFNA